MAYEKGRPTHGRTLACGFSSSSLKLRHDSLHCRLHSGVRASFIKPCLFCPSPLIICIFQLTDFLYSFLFRITFLLFLSVCPSVCTRAAAHISSILFAIALLNYTLNIFSLLWFRVRQRAFTGTHTHTHAYIRLCIYDSPKQTFLAVLFFNLVFSLQSFAFFYCFLFFIEIHFMFIDIAEMHNSCGATNQMRHPPTARGRMHATHRSPFLVWQIRFVLRSAAKTLAVLYNFRFP